MAERESQDQKQDRAAADSEIPPTDFTTFVLGLAQACMHHLGEIPGPEGPNLPMAQHTIELLEMLEEKTQGNLNGEEERLLSQVVSDMRESYHKRAG
jgi:hypothetical protein